MGIDEDFSDFATARWGSLVRSAVFLGATVDDAHDLVQVALLKCYTSWTRVIAADSQDAYVYRLLLNCYRDSRRRRWWAERPSEHLPEVPEADHTHAIEVTDPSIAPWRS